MKSESRMMFGDLVRYILPLIIQSVVPIVTLPILTRIVSTQDYGSYSVVRVGVDVASAFALTGLGGAAIRYIPAFKEPDKQSRLVTVLFTLLIGVVLLGTVGFLALSLLLANNAALADIQQTGMVFSGLIYFVSGSAFGLITAVARGRRMVAMYSYLLIGQIVISAVVGLVWIVGFHGGMREWMYSGSVGFAVVIALAWRRIFPGHLVRWTDFSLDLARQLVRFAFFTSLGNVAYWFLNLSDRWIVALFWTTSQVAIYSVAYDISNKFLLLVISSFTLATSPAFAHTWENQGPSATKELQRAATRMYLIVALPMAVGLSLVAEPAIRIVASSKYSPGAVIVPYIAFSALLYGLSDLFGRGLVLHKRPEIPARNFAVSGVVNVLLNLAFVPQFGYIAAAVATLVGYVVLFVLQYRSVRRFEPWELPWQTLGRLGLACIVMAAGMALSQYRFGSSSTSALFVSLGIGALLYALMVLILKEISVNNVKHIVYGARARLMRTQRVGHV